MSATKQTIQQYNYEYLKQICETQCLKLKKDYSKEKKITRDTIICGNCKGDNCHESFEKNFRALVKFNSYYCKKCSKQISIKKRETTCLEKFGVRYVSQNAEIQTKSQNTCLEKYGDTCALRNTSIKEKSKKTCLEKFGVENPFQNEDIKTKIKNTCLEKYGDTCALRNTSIKEKSKKTCLEKFGFENPSQNEDIKSLKKQTCFKNFGVEHSFQSEEIRNKSKITNINKYGFEFVSCVPEIRRKAETTMFNKFGVYHATQNPDILQKALISGYKYKEYKFPSGQTIQHQGYENYALDELLYTENIPEENILNGLSHVPEIWYDGVDSKRHRYFVDIFISSQKRCIEVKSDYTITRGRETIDLKQNACKDAGYNCEIWVYNRKGEKVECIK